MSTLPPLRRVVVESPYRATDIYSVDQHMSYLRAAMQDCIRMGESPIASHHLIPGGVLDDDTPHERALGIRCGLVWGEHADLIAVYSDLGVSPGMLQAIQYYKGLGKSIAWRTLEYRPGGSATLRAIREMGYP